MSYLSPVKPTWSSLEAPNPVEDWCKIRKLIRDLRRGDKIPPIVIDETCTIAYNGSHRMMANEILEMLEAAGKPNSECRIDTLYVTCLSEEVQEILYTHDCEVAQAWLDE